MTAHEQQDERVVLIHFILRVGRRRRPVELERRGGFSAPAGEFAADVIGHAPGSHLNQPGARIAGAPLPRPLNSRRNQRLLHGVFGVCKVTESADDRSEHLRRKLAQQMLGTGVQRRRRHSSSSGGPLITWRTSIGMLNGVPPGPGAADARAASS